jgi:uncharacterized glyoxalase superfamily protein PhnB
MKNPPAGWPRISSSVFYDDPGAAIDWLCRAFGFEVRLKVEEGGTIVHSELTFEDGLVMVGGAGGEGPGHQKMVSPRSVGGANTQVLAIFVDDVDAHHSRARVAGATIFRELADSDYGSEYPVDRTYGALDPGGHQWFFMQRLRDPSR